MREAILNAVDGATVTSGAGLTCTIRMLAPGEICITQDITIDGGGQINIIGDVADDDETTIGNLIDMSATAIFIAILSASTGEFVESEFEFSPALTACGLISSNGCIKRFAPHDSSAFLGLNPDQEE